MITTEQIANFPVTKEMISYDLIKIYKMIYVSYDELPEDIKKTIRVEIFAFYDNDWWDFMIDFGIEREIYLNLAILLVPGAADTTASLMKPLEFCLDKIATVAFDMAKAETEAANDDYMRIVKAADDRQRVGDVKNNGIDEGGE